MSRRLAAYAVCIDDERVLLALHQAATGQQTWPDSDALPSSTSDSTWQRPFLRPAMSRRYRWAA